jgi:antitoxin ParD1/3/4
MTFNVLLPKELQDYVEAEVEAGRFPSPDAMIGEALRMLQTQDRPLDDDLSRLKASWRAGADSGDFQPIDLDAIKAEGRRRLGL